MPKRKGPEWDNVVILNDNSIRSLNPKVKCVFCEKEFFGGACRIRSHFLGDDRKHVSQCKAVPDAVRQLLEKNDEKRRKEAAKKKKAEALDKATAKNVTAAIGQSTTHTTIPSWTTKGTKEEADRAIARAFFANGIPFNVLDNEYFKDAVKAIAACGPGQSQVTEL